MRGKHPSGRYSATRLCLCHRRPRAGKAPIQRQLLGGEAQRRQSPACAARCRVLCACCVKGFMTEHAPLKTAAGQRCAHRSRSETHYRSVIVTLTALAAAASTNIHGLVVRACCRPRQRNLTDQDCTRFPRPPRQQACELALGAACAGIAKQARRLLGKSGARILHARSEHLSGPRRRAKSPHVRAKAHGHNSATVKRPAARETQGSARSERRRLKRTAAPSQHAHAN